MKPVAATIVLNYNRPNDTLECVESVLAANRTGFALNVFIVDNSEAPDSDAVFRGRFPEVAVIKNEKNLGYAEGNNVGIRAALRSGADYVFILNNDCVLEPATIVRLLAAAEKFPEATILAPLVCFYDNRELIDSCGTRMDWFRLKPRPRRYTAAKDVKLPRQIDCEIVPGSAMLIKKEVFAEAGFFDPDFFLIHEDADLCLRNIAHGHKNLVITDAVVYHKVSRTLRSYPCRATYYTIRNFLRLSADHNPWSMQGVVAAGLFLLAVKKTAALIWSRDGREQLRWFFLGIFDFFAGRKGPCPYPEVIHG